MSIESNAPKKIDRHPMKGAGLVPATRITASGVMLAHGPGWLHKVIMTPDVGPYTTNECVIFDNGAAESGTILAWFRGSYGTSTTMDWPAGLRFSNGLYGVCSGGTSAIMAYYSV